MLFNENPTLALWLVGADGSNLRKIQDLLPPRGVDLTPGGDDAFNLLPALTFYQELAWSPDGQLIAFVSAHQDQVDLYTAALDGTVARLTDTPRLEQGPRWSPDGALIAYRTTSGFGTGAGWGDVALEVTARGGGPPALVMDDRTLAGGSAAVAVPDLLWISPTVIVAGIADSVVGNAELRALDTGTRAATVIFDAPYSALEWNDATGSSRSPEHPKRSCEPKSTRANLRQDCSPGAPMPARRFRSSARRSRRWPGRRRATRWPTASAASSRGCGYGRSAPRAT